MRKKAYTAAAVVILAVFLCGFDFLGLFRQDRPGESAEHVFNMANEAMVKGENAKAVELYYSLIEEYPDFRQYRPDALFRLGTLLFKAERFQEAEKVLQMLAAKYKNYPQIKTVYEKLLYIYVQESRDEGKADKIRKIYEKKYGRGNLLETAEKTEQILNSQADPQRNILKLTPAQISVVKITKGDSYDAEFFPVKCENNTVTVSPDKKMSVERKKAEGRYFLYLSDMGKKAARVTGTKNGFAPQWSWDNKYVVFTAMNWKLKERHIKVFNLKKNTVKDVFGAKTVGPLTCISPDASLVAFWYLNGLWVMNKSGAIVSLVSDKINGEGVSMMAWSREGGAILVRKNIKGLDQLYVCTLGRKELLIVK